MGTVTNIRYHPRFKTANDRKFEAFIKAWGDHVFGSPIPPPDPAEYPRLANVLDDINNNVTFTLDWSRFKSGVDKMGEDCDG